MYSVGQNIRIPHPLKTKIYEKGYTLTSFADKVGICRQTLLSVFKDKHNIREDTLYLISRGLDTTPIEVYRLIIEGRQNNGIQRQNNS